MKKWVIKKRILNIFYLSILLFQNLIHKKLFINQLINLFFEFICGKCRYKEKKGKGNVLKWLYNRIDGYGFEYESEWASKILDIEELNSILEEDEFLLLCMDEAIIATAFGQYKIEGKIDKSLKLVALTAMERQKILNQQTLLSGEIDISKLIQVVDGESTRPDENGQTTHLTNKYIERLEIMKSDLVKFEGK